MSKSILGMPNFVNLAIYLAKSSLILSCSSGSFLFYITLLRVMKEKKRIVSRRERSGGKSVFNNRENGFSYFIYVVIISI